jgi:hypothetical protein
MDSEFNVSACNTALQLCLEPVRDFVARGLVALHAEVAACVHAHPAAPPWSPHHVANAVHEACGLPGRALDMEWPPKLASLAVPCLPVRVTSGGYCGRAIGVKAVPIGTPVEQLELIVERCESGESLHHASVLCAVRAPIVRCALCTRGDPNPASTPMQTTACRWCPLGVWRPLETSSRGLPTFAWRAGPIMSWALRRCSFQVVCLCTPRRRRFEGGLLRHG